MGKPKSNIVLRRISADIKKLYSEEDYSLTSVQVEFLKILRRTKYEYLIRNLSRYRDSAEVQPFVRYCTVKFLEKEILSEAMTNDEVMLIAYLLREVVDKHI